MADEKAPRRYKLPGELDDNERAAIERPGSDGRVERDEYLAWRKRMLRDEQDDLALRGRLATEEAEHLRSIAGRRRSRAHEKLSPSDWHERQLAKQEGREVEPLGDDRADKLDDQAAELEREAAEIGHHNASGEELTPADHYEAMRSHR